MLLIHFIILAHLTSELQSGGVAAQVILRAAFAPQTCGAFHTEQHNGIQLKPAIMFIIH
jgi:hypothetical protein